jgi:hypothetical protein
MNKKKRTQTLLISLVKFDIFVSVLGSLPRSSSIWDEFNEWMYSRVHRRFRAVLASKKKTYTCNFFAKSRYLTSRRKQDKGI